MSDNVILCGCGWLGQKMIEPLQQSGFNPVPTSRSETKYNQWIDLGLNAELFELGSPFPSHILDSAHNSVVLMLPPGRRNPSLDSYLENMLTLLDELADASLSHIIFISTTSVYGDTRTGVLNEKSALDPQTASAKAHVLIEQRLREQFTQNHAIVRLAGLVGADRHPIRSLAGKHLTAPSKRVNLVHSDDVVAGLIAILKRPVINETLLMCSSEHPSRQEYYTWCAKKLGLTPPKFTADDNDGTSKAIDASKSWESLDIELAFPSPYDMISQSAPAQST